MVNSVKEEIAEGLRLKLQEKHWYPIDCVNFILSHPCIAILSEDQSLPALGEYRCAYATRAQKNMLNNNFKRIEEK